MNRKEIAEKLNVSLETIRIYKIELEQEGKLQSINKKERKEKVLELYNQGIDIEEIAKRLNISDATIYKYIKELKEEGKVKKERKKTLRKKKERKKH